VAAVPETDVGRRRSDQVVHEVGNEHFTSERMAGERCIVHGRPEEAVGFVRRAY
jgi:hypothetical protein